MIKKDNQALLKMSNAIRTLTIDAVEKANSGHPGMPMGMADVATILFSEFIRTSSSYPKWPNRDRFILSAGHGSMLLYSILYLTGHKDISIDDIKNFRQLGSKLAGHPEYKNLLAIETTTGPLGQGIANAVGCAISEKIISEKFGDDLVNHYTYVICGDGCLMEGISHESASLAGHLKLSKLIILFDDNGISIDGSTSLTNSDNHKKRFESYNWYVQSIDGHNYDHIREAIRNAQNSQLPSLIACKTIIGYGSFNKSGTEACHGAAFGKIEVDLIKKNLNWPYDDFFIPKDIKDLWEKIGSRNNEEIENWFDNPRSRELCNYLDNKTANNLEELFLNIRKNKLNIKEATRKSSGYIIESIIKDIPSLIGGSADLTGSNNTKSPFMMPISKENFCGNYLYYGAREHAMCSIMNGFALYGGFIPYGGTFLVFSDYARPAIRLAAMMRLQVIYIMTHDSIGLGEDGPTHQPVEQLASLRAIPNLKVFRPADFIETAEVWELALKNFNSPSLLSLTRQDVRQIRKDNCNDDSSINLSAKGAYIISEFQHNLDITIFATGSEVSIALDVQKILHAKNIGTRVISMPCQSLFDEQSKEYIKNILGNNSLKIAIEAASRYGWDRYIGSDGLFFGINSFGASGKAQDLYEYFGLTHDKIAQHIIEIYSKKIYDLLGLVNK